MDQAILTPESQLHAEPTDSPKNSCSSTRTTIETRLVRKAMLDESFRQRLEQSPQAVWEEEFKGSDVANLTLRIFEDTDDTIYLVIPWHAEDFRHQLSDRPRETWKREFGTAKLNGFVIRVLEEPTDEFYLVLPRSEPLEEDDLEAFSNQELDQEDTVSSPALRYLRIRRFTQWRPRNKVERILYLLQAQGLSHLKRFPVVNKFLQPIYTLRSRMYQMKRL
ncbi:MAG: hypothetical protein AAGA75_05820 [Cyanobacteria bacterium P01_E01_bin.6]